MKFGKIGGLVAVIAAVAIAVVGIVQGATTGDAGYIVFGVAGLIGVVIAVIDRARAYLRLEDKDGKPFLEVVFEKLSDLATLLIFIVIAVAAILLFIL